MLHRPLLFGGLLKFLAHAVYGVGILAENAGEVLAIINVYPQVRAVLTGHCHMNTERRFDGVLQITAACLAEKPHAYQVLEVYGDNIHNRVRRLDHFHAIKP